jgi:hypothetical protein
VGSSSERTRTAITAALKKKLKDIMGEFGQLRHRLQQEYRCAQTGLAQAHALPCLLSIPECYNFRPG